MKMITLTPLLLLLGACGAADSTSGEGTSAVESSANTTPSKGWAQAEGDAGVSGALADADLPSLSGQEPRAGKITVNYEPAQEPQFHFDTDAISDAELKEFFLEMDVKIDNEEIGTMTFVLWGDEAPITVRNYLRYADEGFYNGKIFHRIMRDFMIQGGSSNNTASGQGPHPKIKGEFSRDEARRHRYGVLSMARSQSPDSASSQFFVITDSHNPSVHNLNGQYSSFGILYNGISVLEQIAEVEVVNNISGEPSRPTQRVEVTQVRVKRGKPDVEAEEIKRPPIDLNGEAERIRIQHILISFAGTRTAATRTKEEAEALANEYLKRAKAGEDFDSLVLEITDDPGSKGTTPKGSYAILNKGQQKPELSKEQQAELEELNAEVETFVAGLREKVNAGTLPVEQAREQLMNHPAMAKMQAHSWTPRNQLVPAFGDVGFSLEIGEVGMASYDPQASPFGWHIILRYE
ncbi:MAG: peptidylprolyl isomerase [Planctomycetota bacterium]